MGNISLFYLLCLISEIYQEVPGVCKTRLYQSFYDGDEHINLEKTVHLKPKTKLSVLLLPLGFSYIANCTLFVLTPPTYSIILEA